MELNKTKKLIYFLASFSVAVVLLLGSWWLYLVFKLSSSLEEINHPSMQTNLVKMVQWEGLTFILLLVSLTFAIVYIFFQDSKKTHSLQAFFASLTHELKTPLASMKLQAQVLKEMTDEIELNEKDHLRVNKYTDRLIRDSKRLENELDNHLQLARVERGTILQLSPINLNDALKKYLKFYPEIQINLESTSTNFEVYSEEFAFRTIIKNLIENSIRHNKNLPISININIREDNDFIELEFNDNGSEFKGDLKQLGTIFYKHDSPKGSGIGVYLIKCLSSKLGGKLIIESAPNLIFKIRLRKVEDINE